MEGKYQLENVKYVGSHSSKLFLLGEAPLTEPPSETPAKPPIQELRNIRKDYTSSLLEKMRAPDGSYEEGFSVPGVHLDRSSAESSSNLDKNNPLSLHEDVYLHTYMRPLSTDFIRLTESLEGVVLVRGLEAHDPPRC